jgi:beta-xylosidase
MVKAGKGLIDPCPFWDDDGQAYLIHGWARSRSGIKNLLTLHRMAGDGSQVLDPGIIIIDGNKMEGWETIEGPKLYKRDGWYYVFAPAGGVTEGYQAIFRSRDIYGPYENRVVLDQGKTPINGPHQGAWVDTPAGEHWFFHFQEMPAYGRVVHLQPMQWRADGWPVMGNDGDNDGKGQPVLMHRKPRLPLQAISVPATSDDFSGKALGLQWQWQANPAKEWYSLIEKPRALRLECIQLLDTKSLWTAPNLLLQKFSGPEFTATTKLEFSSTIDGERAGLMVFGYDYIWLGLRREKGALKLILASCKEAHKDGKEQDIEARLADSGVIYLRARISSGAKGNFQYSYDGEKFESIGDSFQARSSYWVGGKIGLFASGSIATNSHGSGHADFSFFDMNH